jgi:hypothetical protein
MEYRYWKWDVDGKVLAVFRHRLGLFQVHKNGQWTDSNFYERAVQDPEFIDIDKKEADRTIGKQVLESSLGTDPATWPRHCLVPYPTKFDDEIDQVERAIGLLATEPQLARELVQSVDSESMKRWFINVALQSGFWRATYSGVITDRPIARRSRNSIGQKRLESLFQRDHWQCRYCGIRVGGNRKHFKAFAKAIEMPELIEGRTDETRHGLYLMMMASYDHVVPHNEGGSDEDDNLVTACWGCQFGKYRFGLEALALDPPTRLVSAGIGSWRGFSL